MQAPGPNGVRWFELDFREVTRRKAAIIAGNEPLRKLLGPEAGQSIQPGRLTPASLPAAAVISGGPSELSDAVLRHGTLLGSNPLLSR